MFFFYSFIWVLYIQHLQQYIHVYTQRTIFIQFLYWNHSFLYWINPMGLAHGKIVFDKCICGGWIYFWHMKHNIKYISLYMYNYPEFFWVISCFSCAFSKGVILWCVGWNYINRIYWEKKTMIIKSFYSFANEKFYIIFNFLFANIAGAN